MYLFKSSCFVILTIVCIYHGVIKTLNFVSNLVRVPQLVVTVILLLEYTMDTYFSIPMFLIRLEFCFQ